MSGEGSSALTKVLSIQRHTDSLRERGGESSPRRRLLSRDSWRSSGSGRCDTLCEDRVPKCASACRLRASLLRKSSFTPNVTQTHTHNTTTHTGLAMAHGNPRCSLSLTHTNTHTLTLSVGSVVSLLLTHQTHEANSNAEKRHVFLNGKQTKMQKERIMRKIILHSHSIGFIETERERERESFSVAVEVDAEAADRGCTAVLLHVGRRPTPKGGEP